MNQQLKDYLGDSVYAEFDGYGITLTTDNGHGPSNTIYLEPDILEALNRFKARMIQNAKLYRDASNQQPNHER